MSRVFLLTFFFALTLGYLRIHTISPNHTITTLAEEGAETADLNRVLPRWESQNIADAKVFEDARCKGEKFLAAMKASDIEAGKILAPQVNPPSIRSPWQGDLKLDMRKWGWDLSEDPNEEYMCDYSSLWHVDTPFQALGLSTKPRALGGDKVCYELTHGDPTDDDFDIPLREQHYFVDGKAYTKTGGYCQCAMNYVGGAIIAQSRLSPGSAAERNWKRKPSIDELPALRSMADLLWGFWFRDNPNIKNIKYMWSQAVTNEQTASIIATALRNTGKEIEGWPGTTFDMNTPEGQALLGSQNAVAFAYLLISHKRELGNMAITKAQVFWGNEKDITPTTNRNPELLFYVGNHSVQSEPVKGVSQFMMRLCSPSCCRSRSSDTTKSLAARNTSLPLTGQGILGKRVLPAPTQGAWIFVKDMCNIYSHYIDVETGEDNRRSVGHEYAFGATPYYSCMATLFGCTAVVVVSRKQVWFAHFAEDPSVKYQNRWQNDIFFPLDQGGYGSTVTPGRGLRSLVQEGGPLGPGTNPKAFIFAPKQRRAHWTHPQVNAWAYPEFVAHLDAALRGYGLPVEQKPYIANAATEWNLQRNTMDNIQDIDKPYRTPFGKIVVTYDINTRNVQPGTTRWVGYEIWFADYPTAIAKDEWPAFPGQ